MRPSKSRSRNKSNRNNRTVGNVVNRVFDSSGPEGKVRGTPQQIIEKYNQLARDAQLSGDRVATENFQQHAEHYQRMLNEAQREQEMRREEHERQNRDRQYDRDRGQGGNGGNGEQGERPDPGHAPQPDIFSPVSGTRSGLVETPESRSEARPAEKRQTETRQTETRQTETRPAETRPAETRTETQDATPPAKPARKPRTRKPKPRPDNGNGNGNGNDGGPDRSDGPAEAAE